MTLEDLPQVVRIERENFSAPWSEESFARYISGKEGLFLTACEGRRVVGYIGAILVQDEGDITNVAVDVSRRREGIGKLLVERAIHESADRGVEKLFLEVRAGNRPAIALYEKFGFQRIGIRKRYYRDPEEDALLMSRIDKNAEIC